MQQKRYVVSIIPMNLIFPSILRLAMWYCSSSSSESDPSLSKAENRTTFLLGYRHIQDRWTKNTLLLA